MEFDSIELLADNRTNINRKCILLKATYNKSIVVVKASKSILVLEKEFKHLLLLQDCQFIPQLLTRELQEGLLKIQSKLNTYFYFTMTPFGQVLNQSHSSSIILYLSQIYQAIQFAHSKKIYHRDIKPKNIIIYRNSALLIDWGFSVSFKIETKFNFAMTEKFAASKYLKSLFRDDKVFEYMPTYDFESLLYTLCDILEPTTTLKITNVNKFISERSMVATKYQQQWRLIKRRASYGLLSP